MSNAYVKYSAENGNKPWAQLLCMATPYMAIEMLELEPLSACLLVASASNLELRPRLVPFFGWIFNIGIAVLYSEAKERNVSISMAANDFTSMTR